MNQVKSLELFLDEQQAILSYHNGYEVILEKQPEYNGCTGCHFGLKKYSCGLNEIKEKPKNFKCITWIWKEVK